MDIRNTRLRSSLLPEPILRVPSRAAFRNSNLSTDSGGSIGASNGINVNEESFHEREEVGIYVESREV